jgi:hypothetical protein
MSSQQFGNPQALIQQVMQATESLSDREAAQRYQQILAQLPPDQAEELNALALSQVDPGERRSLASQFRQAHQDPNTAFHGYDFDDDDEAASPMGLGRLSARAQQQDPALFGGMLGGDNPLGGRVGKAALAALATLLIRQMMSGQQGGAMGGGTSTGGMGGMGGMGGADPIGSILGGLLGGVLGGGVGGASTGGMGDMGGMGRAGGSSDTAGRRYDGTLGDAPAGGGMGGIDLGSILGGLLGGGSMARRAPQGGGLGSLLGALLGGDDDRRR